LPFEINSNSDMGERPERVSLLEQVPGDTGNAHRFLAVHRDNARYCHAFKTWFFWDGRRWLRDTQGHAIALAKEVMIEFLKHAIAANNRDAEKLAKSSLDAPRIHALLTLAQDEVSIKPEEFDRQPDLLVFNDGTLNLRTGKFGGFERGDFITKQVFYNHRPDATCQLFLSVLRRLMGAQQDEARAERLVSALQVYFGYSLTGHTSSKAVFMLTGPKDAGKTTVLELFCKLLTEHATLIRIETLMEGPSQRSLGLRADLADLYGKRFARTSETEEGKKLSESQLKYITQGMGSIRGERKFENPFDFEETHKLWIDANHKPVIRGTDEAIWDRIITIPFDVVIPEAEQDPQLKTKLLAEGEGIFAWGVAGARRWYEDGRRLPRPDEVRAAGEVYRADMDTVGRFLEERCNSGASLTVGSSEIYAAYRKWAESGGEHPMSQKSFSSRMKNRQGIESDHTERGTVFVGIGLRKAVASPDTDENGRRTDS
jgi:putative DNA primase/helicase